MLSTKETEAKKALQDRNHIEEALQSEIDFFKKELARVSKKEEVLKTQMEQFTREPEKEMSFNNVMGQLSTPQDKKKVGIEETDVKKLDNLVSKAQASLNKVMTSPFGRQTAGIGNDSLDAMRMDFLNDYNKIMRDSDTDVNNRVTNGLTDKKMTTQEKGGALRQMVEAGQHMEELANLKAENENLRSEISQLKSRPTP